MMFIIKGKSSFVLILLLGEISASDKENYVGLLSFSFCCHI